MNIFFEEGDEEDKEDLELVRVCRRKERRKLCSRKDISLSASHTSKNSGCVDHNP